MHRRAKGHPFDIGGPPVRLIPPHDAAPTAGFDIRPRAAANGH
ncbi:hypothetical protein OH687_25090 [Burkholderia anthina]|nr:hypothetical protein OH687_25090 [Burkholderia anthina]